MIAYTGYFGAGKTLNMTKDLHKAFIRGAFIITNYKTIFSNLVIKNKEEFFKVCMEILSIREGKKYIGEILPNSKNKFKQIYIGLDEAGIYFNARNFRDWQKEAPDFLDFLLQCRKLEVEICYTVQDPGLVDINFRRLTTEWLFFRKFNIIPIVRKQIITIAPESSSLKSGDVHYTSLLWGGKSKVWEMYDTTELCYLDGRGIRNLGFDMILKSEYVKLDPPKKIDKFTKKSIRG